MCPHRRLTECDRRVVNLFRLSCDLSLSFPLSLSLFILKWKTRVTTILHPNERGENVQRFTSPLTFRESKIGFRRKASRKTKHFFLLALNWSNVSLLVFPPSAGSAGKTPTQLWLLPQNGFLCTVQVATENQSKKDFICFQPFDSSKLRC